MERFSNIILIGMPGAGKTTIGKSVSAKTSYDFIDTDDLIRQDCSSLQEFIDKNGHLKFQELEENIILEINCKNCIIATGGSVVYSLTSMKHLKSLGKIIYLDVSLDELERRLGDFKTRGIVIKSDQTIKDLYNERDDLYRRYADITVQANEMIMENIVSII